MHPLSFSELAKITAGNIFSPALWGRKPIENVSIDTRTLVEADLFFALQGEHCDGHHFLQQAISAGAIGAVVSDLDYVWQNVVMQNENAPFLLVPDTLRALQKVAAWNCKQSDCLQIGITGSVGKTTTRHMIHTVLSEAYHGVQNPRNYNNQIGVPVSVLQLNKQHEFAVVEFGASAPGEIAELAQLVEPEIGVLTNIGPAHLDGFGSLINVIQSKAELLDTIGSNGLIILPEETACIPEIKKRLPARVIQVGQSNCCHVFAQQVHFQNNCLQFMIDNKTFQLAVPGKHFLNAALIAYGLARELGMSSQKIQDGFHKFQPVEGRSCLKKIGNWMVLDDCYNANPLSVAAGLDAVSCLGDVKQKIAVLGDMLGLGIDSSHYHRKMGTLVAKSGVNFLLAYGDFADDVAHGAMLAGMSASQIGVFNNLETMQEILHLWIDDQTGLLIKGSRAMKMERVINWLEKQAGINSEAETKPAIPYRQAG